VTVVLAGAPRGCAARANQLRLRKRDSCRLGYLHAAGFRDRWPRPSHPHVRSSRLGLLREGDGGRVKCFRYLGGGARFRLPAVQGARSRALASRRFRTIAVCRPPRSRSAPSPSLSRTHNAESQGPKLARRDFCATSHLPSCAPGAVDGGDRQSGPGIALGAQPTMAVPLMCGALSPPGHWISPG
jgi:hypothetical protein